VKASFEVPRSLFLLYTPFIIGFGFFWAISSFLVIKHYLKTDGIPFSLGFWAFVFPLDAFGIGLFLASKNPYFNFLLPVAIAVWVLSIAVWIYVSSKTFCAIKSGKAFQRPKSVQAQPEEK
jgi:tellurite resistance protein TehA-like permease